MRLASFDSSSIGDSPAPHHLEAIEKVGPAVLDADGAVGLSVVRFWPGDAVELPNPYRQRRLYFT